MKVTVQFFGPAKQFTNNDSERTVELNGSTLDCLLSELTRMYSVELVVYIYNTCGVAINMDYVTLHTDDVQLGYYSILEKCKDVKLADGDEVTVIPPVSSG